MGENQAGGNFVPKDRRIRLDASPRLKVRVDLKRLKRDVALLAIDDRRVVLPPCHRRRQAPNPSISSSIINKMPPKHSSSPLGTPPNQKPAYYVVWRGRKPGIYDSWLECQNQVSRFSNSSFKGFTSYEEAVAAFRDSTLLDKASQGSSSQNCPNCESLKFKIKLLEAKVAYFSEKQGTGSSSKNKSVPDHLEYLSEMLEKQAVLRRH